MSGHPWGCSEEKETVLLSSEGVSETAGAWGPTLEGLVTRLRWEQLGGWKITSLDGFPLIISMLPSLFGGERDRKSRLECPVQWGFIYSFLSKIRYICSHLMVATQAWEHSALLFWARVNLGSAGLTGQRRQAQVAFVTLCSPSSSLFPGSSPWCLILPSQEHRWNPESVHHGCPEQRCACNLSIEKWHHLLGM